MSLVINNPHCSRCGRQTQNQGRFSDNDVTDFLPLPTINWAEEQKEQSAERTVENLAKPKPVLPSDSSERNVGEQPDLTYPIL